MTMTTRERYTKAIKLEKTDRIPVLLMGYTGIARVADPSIINADFIERPM